MLHVLAMGRLGTVTSFFHDQRALNRCLASIRPDIVNSQKTGYSGILANRTRYAAALTIHWILAWEVRFQLEARSCARAAL